MQFPDRKPLFGAVTLFLSQWSALGSGNLWQIDEIEAQIQRVAEFAQPRCVAIRSAKGGWASGVILSSKGTILTAAHAIPPGRTSIDVLFHNGTRSAGIVTQIDHDLDVAVLRFAPKIGTANWEPVASASLPREGVGVRMVAFGHAYGFDAKRGAPVRFGFGYQNEARERIISNCRLSAGDSGGPLFSLSGHLVGINLTVDAKGKHLATHLPVELIFQKWPWLREEVSQGWKPVKLKTDLIRPRSQPLGKLAVSLTSQISASEAMAEELPWEIRRRKLDQAGLHSIWQGQTQLHSSILSAAWSAKRAQVDILHRAKKIGTGTVANGRVFTKASELSRATELTCRLWNGRVIPLTHETTWVTYDLAVFTSRVDLKACSIPTSAAPAELGQVVALPSGEIGIVSSSQVYPRGKMANSSRTDQISSHEKALGIKLSNRRDGFRQIFETDLDIRPQDCGAPVIDAFGNLIGIAIARAAHHATYVIPIRAL